MVIGSQDSAVHADASAGSSASLSFSGLVKRFAPASAFLSKHDDVLMDEIQVVGKRYMEQQVLAPTTAAGRRPVLMVYGSDLTPMLLKFRTTVTVSDRVELREGSRACEWRVHKAFYVWINDQHKFEVRAQEYHCRTW